MPNIVNFIENIEETKNCLRECLDEFFNKNTLVLNDTRLMIIPSVLPHIPFVGGYDQRVLPILKNTTVIFSKPFSEKTLHYYNSLGLSNNIDILQVDNIPEITLTENILSDKDLVGKIRNKWFKRLINFWINENVEKLAESIGAKTLVSSEISNLANNKLKLKQFLEKEWLPTVNGTYTSSPQIITEYFNQTEHFFFKDPLGVSGYGFWSNKKNTLEEILIQYKGKELIIEQVIEKEDSPSIQFCIYGEQEKKAVIFGFTDQILEWGQHYMGNTSPSKYHKENGITEEFISQSEAIIKYLIDIWYVWFGGIDFMISTDKKVFATEVNARFTGATYPAISSFLLNESLNTPWKYITKEWITESIQEYLHISIKQKDEYWLFPICIAPLEWYGRAQLLFIGELDEHDL